MAKMLAFLPRLGLSYCRLCQLPGFRQAYDDFGLVVVDGAHSPAHWGVRVSSIGSLESRPYNKKNGDSVVDSCRLVR